MERLAYYRIGLLFVLLFAAGVVHCHTHSEAEDADNTPMPKVSIGILRRATSCSPEERIPTGAFATISIRLFTDISKENRVEVFHSEEKPIHGIGRITTFPGLEMGLLGACVGEIRMIHIPTQLGFAEMGNSKLNIPPNAALRAKVEIKSFHMPTREEMEEEEYQVDLDFNDESPESHSANAELEDIEDVPFPAEVKQLDDKTFESETSGKHVFLLVYAPWCRHCKEFKPAFGKVAKAFADQSDLLVVAVEGTENEAVATQFSVQGFPTILLRKSTGEVVPYDEERNAASVVSFLNKELSKNVVLAV